MLKFAATIIIMLWTILNLYRSNIQILLDFAHLCLTQMLRTQVNSNSRDNVLHPRIPSKTQTVPDIHPIPSIKNIRQERGRRDEDDRVPWLVFQKKKKEKSSIKEEERERENKSLRFTYTHRHWQPSRNPFEVVKLKLKLTLKFYYPMK